ncbi:MAG: DUF1365 domain-containing protein [Lacunisphaera sp.]
MNSCLYECRVMHHRFAPKAHRFDYRIFMFALDLDEVDSLHRKLRLFSFNRRNAYSFREPDFLPTTEPTHNSSTPDSRSAPAVVAGSLKSRVLAHLATRGIDLTGGRVTLVTLPRVFGYLFNPVSFYFCYDRNNRPVAALAEVTNTFKEMKPYLLGPETRATAAKGTTFSLRTPKFFYVSPFTDIDVAFDFTLHAPGDKLSVQIDDYAAGQRTLTSVLRGTARPLTDARLAWFSIKYPLITLRIISLIHWHALKLYLKKIPWFAKAARPEAQRDLYRPHTSIANSPKA